jgi:hypothetical protein
MTYCIANIRADTAHLRHSKAYPRDRGGIAVFYIRPSLPSDPDLSSILQHTGCVEGAQKLKLENSRHFTLYLSLSPNTQFPLFGELDVPTNPHSTPIQSSKPLALSRVPTSPSDPNMISNTLYDNFHTASVTSSSVLCTSIDAMTSTISEDPKPKS